jgi:hypothetical protein
LKKKDVFTVYFCEEMGQIVETEAASLAVMTRRQVQTVTDNKIISI